MPEETADVNRIKNGLGKVLNSHGYGFHYATLKRAVDAYEKTGKGWFFNVAEYPVEGQGFGTRIDFILRKAGASVPYFLVAECKRVNPSLSDWCFVRSPYWYYGEPSLPQLILEHLLIDQTGDISSFGYGYQFERQAYGVALELRTKTEGDMQGSGRGAIEEAASQVIRGVSGFVNTIAKNNNIIESGKYAVFLPVVFTTAKLWVSDVKLEESDILTGKIDLSTSSLKSAPWVTLHYPVSPGIKHSVQSKQKGTLWDLYVNGHLRTICVVNADAIEEFLQLSASFHHNMSMNHPAFWLNK